MRKVFAYLLVVIVLCFSIPIIFTKQFEKKETIAEINNVKKEEEGTTYDYRNYKIIACGH